MSGLMFKDTGTYYVPKEIMKCVVQDDAGCIDVIEEQVDSHMENGSTRGLDFDANDAKSFIRTCKLYKSITHNLFQ